MLNWTRTADVWEARLGDRDYRVEQFAGGWIVLYGPRQPSDPEAHAHITGPFATPEIALRNADRNAAWVNSFSHLD
jgi:hypothetical protein